MSQIAKIEQPSNAVTPMEMLDRAVSSGATPETLEKLLNLQERWEASQARKAYIAAMAQARTEFQPLLKRHSGYNDRYKYETLDDVIEAVGPSLINNGFNYDWKTEDTAEGMVRVTCVITHEDGHERTNTMSGDPQTVADSKANMNSVQRVGAVVTYLQRYTLKAALGIAASKDDDSKGLPEMDRGPLIDKIAAAKTGDEIRAVQAELTELGKNMAEHDYKFFKAYFADHIKKLKEKNNG